MHKILTESLDAQVGQVERELVRIFLDTCLFEWQTGHHELAVGLLQAQAEYSVFGPRIQASEASKQTLFQRFWDSGAPRIGESGAVGWGTWLAKEEERLQNWGGGVGEAEEEEEEKGGWSGWQDLKEIGGPGGGRGSGSEGGGQSDGEDEGSEGGEVEEESDEALLKRLGINLDAADAVDAAGVDTWRKWAVEEETRDEQQWLPVRPREGEVSDAEETDGELQRTVLFDDVQPFFFSLETDAAGDELLAGFGGFCEAPIPPLTTSNEAQWTEARELITGSLRDHLIRATAEEGKADVTFTSAAAAMPEVMQTELRLAQGGEILANLVGGPPWLDQDPPERRQFAANLLLQASGAFPASSPIARALLAVTSAGDVSGREARGLAKALLKGRREDLALWGAYAELEARAGNAGAARKVFGTALGSVSALPPAAQERAPELCLSFAEMELRLDEKTGGQDARGESNGQMGSGRQAALHILACFGEGEAFRPTETGVVTPSRILKVKRFNVARFILLAVSYLACLNQLGCFSTLIRMCY